MGIEGLAELAKFVQEGGTLITEGSTSIIFPEYGLTTDVSVEQPGQLFARGTILRGRISDPASPIVYGYAGSELPVYFNQSPVLNAGAGGGGRGGAPNAGVGQTITPNAAPLRISPYQPSDTEPQESPVPPSAQDVAELRQRGVGAAAPQAGAGGGRGNARARVVLQFPADANQMLLSGTLANGQALANRAIVVDNRLGEGHLVMFATRPFWRWQTHGMFTLAFNAIMNWNDLAAR
jgi:hypothetical protein